MDEPHIPLPTLWPLGFAVGIAVALVGLIVDPMLVLPIGRCDRDRLRVLWARDATTEMRGHAVAVEPETRELAPAAVAVESACGIGLRERCRAVASSRPPRSASAA